MVEVEEGGLGALEEDRVALRHVPVQHERDVDDPPAVPLAERGELG